MFPVAENDRPHSPAPCASDGSLSPPLTPQPPFRTQPHYDPYATPIGLIPWNPAAVCPPAYTSCEETDRKEAVTDDPMDTSSDVNARMSISWPRPCVTAADAMLAPPAASSQTVPSHTGGWFRSLFQFFQSDVHDGQTDERERRSITSAFASHIVQAHNGGGVSPDVPCETKTDDEDRMVLVDEAIRDNTPQSGHFSSRSTRATRRSSNVNVPRAAACTRRGKRKSYSSFITKFVPYLYSPKIKSDSELYDPAVLRRLVLLTQAACPLDVNELNLRRCAINGDADGIEQLLSQTGVNPNAADTGGWSALILASRYGFLEAVRVLLEHGADINQETNEGWTALMYAVYNKHAGIVTTLLEHETPPQLEHGTKTNAGWTALMYATYIGSQEIMQILTTAYPPANILHETPKGASAITCARMKRRKDLKHFLEYESIFQRKELVVKGIDAAYGAWVPMDIAHLISEFTTFF